MFRDADPSRPGYRHIVFRPVPPDSLTFARYDKETPYGEASIEWRKENGRFEMTVQVPVGCTATVWVPGARSSDSVSTDVGRAGRDKNLSFEGIRDGYAVYEVRSGRYGFRVE